MTHFSTLMPLYLQQNMVVSSTAAADFLIFRYCMLPYRLKAGHQPFITVVLNSYSLKIKVNEGCGTIIEKL
jgi:hypothetical protein